MYLIRFNSIDYSWPFNRQCDYSLSSRFSQLTVKQTRLQDGLVRPVLSLSALPCWAAEKDKSFRSILSCKSVEYSGSKKIGIENRTGTVKKLFQIVNKTGTVFLWLPVSSIFWLVYICSIVLVSCMFWTKYFSINIMHRLC